MQFTDAKEAAQYLVNTLEKAKPFIWNGKPDSREGENNRQFICHAISDSTGWVWDEWQTGEYARKYIERAMWVDGQSVGCTFESWLDHQYGSAYRNSLTREQIQAMRLKWVNKIIADLTRDYLS